MSWRRGSRDAEGSGLVKGKRRNPRHQTGTAERLILWNDYVLVPAGAHHKLFITPSRLPFRPQGEAEWLLDWSQH
jgi:hypothetical protein